MASTKRHKNNLDWAALLTVAISGEPDKVPKGYLRREELEKVWGLGRSATTERVSKLTQMKLCERRVFKLKTSGMLRDVPHYRIAKRA